MVMGVVHEDMGEGNMQCTNHPYKNSIPGGICAFCLQEKLVKLVSSSFPVAIFPSSSTSDFGGSNTTTAGGEAGACSQNVSDDGNYHGYYSRRTRLPFILTQKKKKKDGVVMGGSDSSSIVFKRSKSTATPRRGTHLNFSQDYSPHRRGFWSFLYISKHSTAKKSDKNSKDLNLTSATASTVGTSSVNSGGIRSRENKREDFVVAEENGSPEHATLDRKVSRSRSVGCGSRNFSGDCTLSRVESQRKGKPKNEMKGQDCIKERVRCGGIFGGFMITSSSSSYWVDYNNGNSKFIS